MKNWILKSALLLLCTTAIYSFSFCQPYLSWKAGIGIQFGTHVRRIGIMYQIYLYGSSFQVSQGTWLNYNFRGLGPKGKFLELKAQLGFQYSWIDQKNPKYMLNEFSNMTSKDNNFGYSFYWYLDNRKTSQTTGALNLSISKFTFVMDNDAFGLNAIDDKFRTGGIYLGWREDSLLMGLQATLWTGKSSGSPAVRDTSYPSRYGYRDISETPFGSSSHGILAVRADYLLYFKQTIRAEAGIDAEQIRHVLQNKLIHDATSRRLVRSKNPHYPMLQEDGNMYLFKEGQDIRKPDLYLQLSGNQPLFY